MKLRTEWAGGLDLLPTWALDGPGATRPHDGFIVSARAITSD